jgi:heparosan-N-sulfate-glucuronate 5-epimerase
MRGGFRRNLDSALSRGPGYEPQPAGRHLDTRRVRGYFIDFRAKTTSQTATRPDALVPAGLAQLALGWWERHLDGEDAALGRFLDVADALERRGVRRGPELHWPYELPLRKYGVAGGWSSALAQAQAASVFVRARLAGRDDRHGDLALQAIRPLLPGSSSGLLAATAAGPVPEEAPSEPPSLILNGWIYALWGLWEVAAALGDESCRRLYDESMDCLLRTIGRYDTGWWSLYSLYPHRLPDLAKPFYHRLHVHQLETTERLVGTGALVEVARRWRSYDTAPRRVGAIAQKALFVAVR